MISFKTTSYFRKRLQTLTSFKRGVYAGVQDEIYTAFAGAPIEQICPLM